MSSSEKCTASSTGWQHILSIATGLYLMQYILFLLDFRIYSDQGVDYSQKRKGVMSGFQLVIGAIGSCCHEFEHRSAAVSLEKGDPTPDSKSLGPTFHQGVLDVSAHYMCCRRIDKVYAGFYSTFHLFGETSSRPNFIFSSCPEKRSETGICMPLSDADFVSSNFTEWGGADIRK